jgi:threonine/homoserine/homoserine lactone efflux protein
MLTGLLIGLATGFGMAIPPGPINFAIFDKSIQGRKRDAYLLLAGALAGDFLYCLLAIVYQLSTEWLRLVKLSFSSFGGVFLIVLGLLYIFSKQPSADPTAVHEVNSSAQGHFITGMLFALSNPFFIIALIAVTELYYSIGLMNVDVRTGLAFILGFEAGAFLWLSAVGKFASLNKHRFTNAKHIIRKLCGVAYFFFGLYLLAKFLKLMGWLNIL